MDGYSDGEGMNFVAKEKRGYARKGGRQLKSALMGRGYGFIAKKWDNRVLGRILNGGNRSTAATARSHVAHRETSISQRFHRQFITSLLAR
jgi:hypothetical protein